MMTTTLRAEIQAGFRARGWERRSALGSSQRVARYRLTAVDAASSAGPQRYDFLSVLCYWHKGEAHITNLTTGEPAEVIPLASLPSKLGWA